MPISAGEPRDALIQDIIIPYLARLDPARRSYAEAYLAWRQSTGGEAPDAQGLSNHASCAMRKRLDAMLRGESTFRRGG